MSKDEFSKLTMVGTEPGKEIQEIKTALGTQPDKDKEEDKRGKGRWRKKADAVNEVAVEEDSPTNNAP